MMLALSLSRLTHQSPLPNLTHRLPRQYGQRPHLIQRTTRKKTVNFKGTKHRTLHRKFKRGRGSEVKHDLGGRVGLLLGNRRV